MIGRTGSSICAHTAELLRAEHGGRLPDELAAHAADCSACADALLLDGLLHEDAELAFRQAEIPAAAVAWWRASLAERRQEEMRALRPIAVWEWISAAAVAVLALALLPGIQGALFSWAKELGSAWTLVESLSALMSSGAGPLLFVGAAIPLLAVAGGLIWAWSDG